MPEKARINQPVIRPESEFYKNRKYLAGFDPDPKYRHLIFLMPSTHFSLHSPFPTSNPFPCLVTAHDPHPHPRHLFLQSHTHLEVDPVDLTVLVLQLRSHVQSHISEIAYHCIHLTHVLLHFSFPCVICDPEKK